MENVKHTPGPWSIHPAYENDECAAVHPEDGGKPWIFRDVPIASGEKTVAHANFWTAEGGFPRVDNEAEMLANARLIASAPELLEIAISNAEYRAARDSEFGRGYNAAKNGQRRDVQKESADWYAGYDARAAIYKATGGA